MENKGMFLLNLQLAARNFRTKRILVSKESTAGLLTEQACANHLTQQRMRMILRVASFFIHVGQVGQNIVQTNQIGSMKRANLHAGTQLHCAVDVRRACNVVCIDADSLVDFRNQNTVYNETSTLVYNDRMLVNTLHDVDNGVNNSLIGADGAGNLNQLHDMSRIEEMHTEDVIGTMRNSASNLRDRQRGGVGANDAVLIQNGVQLLEQGNLVIQMLVDAKVLYRCERFDLKSRKSLRGEEKYYLADPGIYFARNVDVRLNYGPSLENALYIYLRSRGYKLSVGRIGKLECDFIARRRNAYAYIQVSMTIADRDVEEREYRPFGYIRDGYPRYLFTLDPLLQERDGVRHLNMVSFMKDNGDLI